MGMSMGWGEAALLGLIQGLTEFLPVSSSAHLRIIGPLLPSGGDPGAAFTAITQIGTEMAVLVYFRSDIWRIFKAWCFSHLGGAHRNNPDARMGWLILIGSVPIAVLGLLFQDAVEGSLRNLYITASMLILFSLPLAIADRWGAKTHSLSHLGWFHGLVFGFAQALALIPGVSRSGGTITAGLIMGYTREAAARYSFLLAIPAVFASGGYQLFKTLGQTGTQLAFGPTALATAVAFLAGFGVIVAFLKLVSSKGYMPFVYYRLCLGALVFVLLGMGILAP
ncbi:MAG: hypothetical protein RL297_195 [Pseudomonadota bacterium]